MESVSDERLATVKRRHVLAVYKACGQNKQWAAERLGVSVKTLYNLLNRLVEDGHMTRAEANLR